jgi:5-methylcytosine-specific restriction endonuclease McrA
MKRVHPATMGAAKHNAKAPRRRKFRRTARSEWKRNGEVHYARYLRSEPWAKKRRLVLARDGYQCQKCQSGRDLHVHHKTYERLGREKLQDLLTLCEPCHMRHHNRESGPKSPQVSRLRLTGDTPPVKRRTAGRATRGSSIQASGPCETEAVTSTASRQPDSEPSVPGLPQTH